MRLSPAIQWYPAIPMRGAMKIRVPEIIKEINYLFGEPTGWYYSFVFFLKHLRDRK